MSADSSEDVSPGRKSSDERHADTKRRRGEGGGLTLTAVAALLAAIASTIGVAVQVLPKHHFHASLAVVPLPTPNMTYGHYLKGIRHATHGGRCGIVVSLRADIRGVDRSRLRLSSAIYGTSKKAILTWNQPLREVFRKGVPINEQIGRAWIPTPDADGHYYAHFELYADQAFIAYADSRQFKVNKRPFFVPCET